MAAPPPSLPSTYTPPSSAIPASDSNPAPSSASSFPFPPYYSFPPFWTPQPTVATRQAQLHKWSSLIQSYCRAKRIWNLTLVDALETPLFHNARLRKRLTLGEVRDVVDWMTKEEGGRRAEWVGKAGERLGGAGGGTAWIYWRRPEEWAEVIAGWVDETGQKNTVLTLYELTEGEGVTAQEFRGMDPTLLQKSLDILVKRGKAQIFGQEDQQGVKFF
ncbi:hypothetical protein MMC25_005149 [Agyrium rufum]|nr:hypothetical protein [Agyrium rufum]